MMRIVFVCMRVSIVLALAACVACSGKRPYVKTRNTSVEKDDVPITDHASAEQGDSLNEKKNGPRETELLDALSDDGTLAAPANEAWVEDETRPSPREEDFSCEITAIAGYRSDTRARVDGWHGLSGGVRVGESAPIGYVGVGGHGALAGLQVGRFKVRTGERLILGRGIGSYATSGSGAVREGFAVSPSLSRWFGENGAALGVEWAGWRCHTVVFSRGEGKWSQPRTVWVSVVRRMEWGMAGITAGEPLASASEDAGGDTSGNESLAVTRPRVVSCHGSFRGDGLGGSCEVAHIAQGEVFFAARMTQQRLRSHCRWTVLLFRAPYSSPNGETGLEPVTKADQGVRLDLSLRLGGVRALAVLISGRTWSPSRLRSYRRLSVAFEGGARRSIRWEASAQARSDAEDAYPTGAFIREVSPDISRELRLRAAVETGGGKGVNTSARIEYLPRIDDIAPGVLLGVATELTTERVEARVQLTAHSLPPGRRGFASRPGVGPFESLAPLYGKGSDLSVRLRARVWGSATLVVFYGSAWSEEERLYIGAEYRR